MNALSLKPFDKNASIEKFIMTFSQFFAFFISLFNVYFYIFCIALTFLHLFYFYTFFFFFWNLYDLSIWFSGVARIFNWEELSIILLESYTYVRGNRGFTSRQIWTICFRYYAFSTFYLVLFYIKRAEEVQRRQNMDSNGMKNKIKIHQLPTTGC